MRRRTFVAATLALAALLCGATTASALTVESRFGADRFVVAGATGAGENLKITVTGRTAAFFVSGGTTLTVGAGSDGGCSLTAANLVTCVASTDFAGLELDLAGGDDVLELATPLGVFAADFEPSLNLGSGDDTLKLDVPYTGFSALVLANPGNADRLDLSARTSPVTASLAPGGASSISGEPSFKPNGFEQIMGSAGNDALTATGGGGLLSGGPGNDVLRGSGDADRLDGGDDVDDLGGGAGDDLLVGGAGKDVYSGGPGNDLVSYQDRSIGVSVSLDGVANDGSGGEGENVPDADVEGVRGGGGNDELIGGPQPDRLEGGGGNDRLDGRGAADALVGGAGVDTADYSSRSAAVAVSVDDAANDGQAGEGDNADAEILLGGAQNDTLIGSDAGGETLRGGPGDDTLQGRRGADVLDGEAGTDTVSYAERSADDPVTVTLDVNVDADDGSTGEGDRVFAENVRGGAGADLLLGDAGSNTLDGGPGADLLDGDLGADDLSGGDGIDTVAYFARTASVSASLNNAADDGAAGEQDRIRNDVEQLQGGNGNDSLSGDGGANLLQGLGGNDVLDGGEGADRLEGGDGDDALSGGGGTDSFLGGAGADTLTAFDGLPEDVDCGADADAATVDVSDTTRECEALTKPGVVTPPAPNPDPDGDGALVPADCNEGDPKIKPGAVDTPGDKIDQDCSGADARYTRISSAVSNAWVSTTKGSVLRRLLVADVPAGGRVEIRCTPAKRAKKSTCLFSRKTFTPKRGTVNALSAFKKKRLPVGTVVEVRITAPLMIGKVVRFTVRSRKISPATALCLVPGATKPARC